MKYFPFGIVKVTGNSMLPTYKPGEFLLVSFLPYIFNDPKVEDVVVVLVNNTQMVKRIQKVDTSQSLSFPRSWETSKLSKKQIPDQVGNDDMSDIYYVLGYNPNESTDSRSFGPVLRKQILAKVLLTF